MGRCGGRSRTAAYMAPFGTDSSMASQAATSGVCAPHARVRVGERVRVRGRARVPCDVVHVLTNCVCVAVSVYVWSCVCLRAGIACRTGGHLCSGTCRASASATTSSSHTASLRSPNTPVRAHARNTHAHTARTHTRKHTHTKTHTHTHTQTHTHTHALTRTRTHAHTHTWETALPLHVLLQGTHQLKPVHSPPLPAPSPPFHPTIPSPCLLPPCAQQRAHTRCGSRRVGCLPRATRKMPRAPCGMGMRLRMHIGMQAVGGVPCRASEHGRARPPHASCARPLPHTLTPCPCRMPDAGCLLLAARDWMVVALTHLLRG